MEAGHRYVFGAGDEVPGGAIDGAGQRPAIIPYHFDKRLDLIWMADIDDETRNLRPGRLCHLPRAFLDHRSAATGDVDPRAELGEPSRHCIANRSEARRVGDELVSTCGSRWATSNYKKKYNNTNNQ